MPPEDRQASSPSDSSQSHSDFKALTVAIAVSAFISFMFFVSYFVQGGGAENASKGEAKAPTLEELQKQIENYEPVNEWSYSRYPDKVRGGFTDKACKRSKEKVYLEWPYEPVYALICLRVNPNKSKDVYVELIGDGQILCNSYDGCRLPVRLGDLGKPKFYSGVGPSDGSSNIVFLTPSGKLFETLQNGTKAIVEIEFYQAGRQQIEFDTTGLESGRL